MNPSTFRPEARPAPCRRGRGSLERRITVLCVVLSLLGVLLVSRMPRHIQAMEENRQNEAQFSEFAELFAEIYRQINERYVDEVEPRTLFEGAINGMMSTLDPHSSWLPPDLQEDLTKDTEGEYSGVGLHITLRDGVLTVIAPIPGGPSERAGVQPWDRIIEIDGETTKDISLIEAVKRLTGPVNTTVDITVLRRGESTSLEFTIRREVIHVQSVFTRILDEDIGLLRISKFQEDTAYEVRRALEAFNRREVRGIIVDLRNNAGGLLDKCVEICDMFLPRGQLIVSIKGRMGENGPVSASDNREFVARSGAISRQPLIVLVNRGSASASEIFAGAMQDTGRGVIVGAKGTSTFGKGSVQTISQLRHSLERDENGDYRPSGLRLTTARYYTPSGKSIHEIGIEPDIGVEVPQGMEAQLIMRGGLLGDVNFVEPGDAPADDEPGQPAEPGEDDTDGAGTPDGEDGAPSFSEQVGEQLNPDAEEPGDQPRDYLLEKAQEYLRAILIYSGSDAA